LDTVTISITQKNKYLLDPLLDIYAGKISILTPHKEGFKYEIYRKSELFFLIDYYFTNYPLKTSKNKRLTLIKEYFSIKSYKNDPDLDKRNL
jgi:hypothetical protein